MILDWIDVYSAELMWTERQTDALRADHVLVVAYFELCILFIIVVFQSCVLYADAAVAQLFQSMRLGYY